MKILVPVDGSQNSMDALNVAIDYAKSKEAKICLINVMPVIEDIDLEITASERVKIKESMEKRAEYITQKACGVLALENVMAICKAIVQSSSVPDAIVDFAEKEKTDLIIIGSRGLNPSVRFRMGSVASKVVKHSPCSVYVVK
ncbi:MAG: universal stress protein [Nitrospiraceae bacterium]|nr:MAG: universal stress protein [Nitrospiraceae bacterium]